MRRFFSALWNWYSRKTGYEMAALQRRTGLKIQSTVYPPKGGAA